MTPYEGYKLAKADIQAYIKTGKRLVSGRLKWGEKRCALGVLYDAAAVDLDTQYTTRTKAKMCARYDGARLESITAANDGSVPSKREETVMEWLDLRIQQAKGLDS